MPRAPDNTDTTLWGVRIVRARWASGVSGVLAGVTHE
jgi:hypothetical protein